MTSPTEAPPAAGAPAAVPVRDAATLLLARDGFEGVEVLLLRRTATAVFVPGAYVFPGGAVDAADHAAAGAGVAVGRADRGASAQVGLERGGLALWVAAVRECFEETGILLAERAGDGALFDPGTDADLLASLAVARRAVHAGHRAFAAWLQGLDLTVPAHRIHFLARWITPPGNTRRFDARFLVAVAPPGQQAEPDGFELDDALWISPAAALARHRAGSLELVLPTSRTLETVAAFASVAELLAAADTGSLAEPEPRDG